jgi:DNA-binding CsgD family transcriptional regulator
MVLPELRSESRPGVFAFTLSLELLYMNHEAQELSRYLNRSRGGPAANGLLPSDVTKLCEEILRRLHTQADAKDWQQVHVRRMGGELSRPIMLQGFGIPDASGLEHSLIIVLMEERESRTDARIEAARTRYGLTDREMNVLENLAKGLTNKEIGITLGIAEQTIKEHLKHIMEKTQVSTRTAVLAQLFQGHIQRPAKRELPRVVKRTPRLVANGTK